MKGIIIVDIPVSDEVEIDEYGMVADMHIRATTLTMRDDLFFDLKDVPIRPFNVKAIKMGNHDFIAYNKEYLFKNLDREIEMLKEGKKYYESNNNN